MASFRTNVPKMSSTPTHGSASSIRSGITSASASATPSGASTRATSPSPSTARTQGIKSVKPTYDSIPSTASTGLPKSSTWLIGLRTGPNRTPEQWLMKIESKPKAAEKKDSMRTARSY